ncbi:MAG: sporulation protein YqfD [Clostridia bacterium]|nr:sporulation protein YqfD [Clostridia bacterium]
MTKRDLFNSFLGCVEFCAENGFAERFVNICTAENIPLWDMHRLSNGMTAKTTVNGYKRIRRVAHRSSMRVRILKKIGLPFIIDRHLKRKGLIAGLVVMFCLLGLLSGRVWIIEISGNETLSRTEIVDAFEKAGLLTGSKIDRLDITEIENEAALNLEKVAWTAINFKGCVAEIKLRERNEKPEIETHSGYSNIIARKDGQIEKLEVYSGSGVLTPGQTVTKGDLIISGVTENKYQVNLYTDADGYVVAKTHINVQTHTPKKITSLVPKTKKVWSFYVLGKEIFPPKKQEGICYEHRSRAVIKNKVLPFGINYRLYTVFEKKEKTISPAEARLMAINDYALESYKQTLHAQIIDHEIEIKETDDGLDIHGKYFCYEDIAEKISLEVEESKNLTEQ